MSVQSQQKFTNNLLEICQNHTKAALAASDRMSVPSSVPRNRRDIMRYEQLEKVVNIIRHTMGSSRVLELPNMTMPNIVDSSVRIWTKSESDRFDDEGSSSQSEDNHPKSECSFGKPAKGDERIWEELEVMTVAEVNSDGKGGDGNKSSPEETITAALAKIEDPQQRRCIAEIDKEKQNRAMVERSKKKNLKMIPVVRAREEPIYCDFQMKNPLGIEVKITEIQLVARMVTVSEGNKKTCTNEFAIQLNDGNLSEFHKSDWTFASADDLEFKIPNFCRISEKGVKSCTSAQENPFFVVTKQAVTIPADGQLLVSAGITPLVEGDLEILGVRCKLEDKVWLYHAFDIPGPLLKDTRTNIMNKARGKSVYLKAKIERDMPCLTAELIKRFPADSPSGVSDDGPMLLGQISMWTIRLRNVGNAPATGLVLKTSLPWIDMVENEKDAAKSILTLSEKESRSISRCIGPSGTLMALPVDKDHKILSTSVVFVTETLLEVF